MRVSASLLSPALIQIPKREIQYRDDNARHFRAPGFPGEIGLLGGLPIGRSLMRIGCTIW
jgi:hypothetical protein